MPKHVIFSLFDQLMHVICSLCDVAYVKPSTLASEQDVGALQLKQGVAGSGRLAALLDVLEVVIVVALVEY